MISLVVACARNRAIGRGNTIPWHAPEDLKFFMRETMGGAVIMGRKTWESLPVRPLKGRMNIVVTSQGVEGADCQVPDLRAALTAAQEAGHARIYGIGGASIYAGLLPLADRLLITHVDLDVPDADTYFPVYQPEEWAVTGELALRSQMPACHVQELLRIR